MTGKQRFRMLVRIKQMSRAELRKHLRNPDTDPKHRVHIYAELVRRRRTR